MTKQPKSITQTLYVEYHKHSDQPYQLSCVDMSQYRPVLGTVEVTVDLPADLADPVAAQLAGLTQQRERIQSEARDKLDAIDEQIQSLQALEYTA